MPVKSVDPSIPTDAAVLDGAKVDAPGVHAKAVNNEGPQPTTITYSSSNKHRSAKIPRTHDATDVTQHEREETSGEEEEEDEDDHRPRKLAVPDFVSWNARKEDEQHQQKKNGMPFQSFYPGNPMNNTGNKYKETLPGTNGNNYGTVTFDNGTSFRYSTEDLDDPFGEENDA